MTEFRDTSGALTALVEMRAATTNQLDDYRVHIDFFSDVRRQVDLIIEMVRSLQLALGNKGTAALEAKLRNQFQLSTERKRHEFLLLEVRFGQHSHLDANHAGE